MTFSMESPYKEEQENCKNEKCPILVEEPSGLITSAFVCYNCPKKNIKLMEK